MKLLAATTRYYLALAALLFALGSAGLFWGVQRVLRGAVEERLFQERDFLRAAVRRTGRFPAAPFEGRVLRSATPRPEGLRRVLLPEPLENELEPYLQLTFRLERAGGPEWVTLRKSLLETEDLLALIVPVQLGVLALLLLGVVGLNRWLSGRLWQPFDQTLKQLRDYGQQPDQVLHLPPTAIAEFAQLNAALATMSARVAASYTTLREFTENAAHETRTPLAIMQAKLEQLLQVPHLPAAAEPLVANLYAATQRLARLHQGLSLLSKIDNRQFAQAEPVQLDQLLREKLRQLADFIAAKDLRLETALAPAPPLRLHPVLVDSLLNNLLHNAIRHNQPGGLLRVTLNSRELTITNSGPALPPDADPARFFERFHKQNPASESPGLGLSIVQRIAEFYGFRVRYEYAAGPPRHTLRVVF